MVAFLKVEIATNLVLGTQRGGSIPPAPPGWRFVERTDAEMAEFHALEKQASNERRKAVITEIGGVVELAPDTRPFIDATVDKTEIDADGVDTAILTVRVLKPDGTPNTGFNGTVRAVIFGAFYVKFEFTAGVATKNLKTTQSGIYPMGSTNDYRLKSPLTISAYA